jgi:hypothetical protein
LSFQPTGELECKATLATTGGRRKKKDFSTGGQRIDDLGLTELIAYERTTMVDERAARGVFEESAIVGVGVDECLPLWLPDEAVSQLRREQ